MPARDCSRTACSRPAVSSLTFVYADSTAVLGPLSRLSEPHAYDLCGEHASRMTPPRGWELLRVSGGEGASDDLVALADAVRPPQDRAEPAHPGRREPALQDRRGTGRTDRPGTDPAGGPASSSRPAHGTHRSGAGDAPPPRHLHVLRSTND